MRNIIITLTLSLFILASCSKDEDYMNKAEITGLDFRECVCCGGWFIIIESKQYRFYELPNTSKIDLSKESFPLDVELDWKVDNNACLGDEIKIIAVRKK